MGAVVVTEAHCAAAAQWWNTWRAPGDEWDAVPQLARVIAEAEARGEERMRHLAAKACDAIAEECDRNGPGASVVALTVLSVGHRIRRIQIGSSEP